jgi:hypothetical protein
MWDKIVEYFLADPKRLRSFGSGLVSVGCWVAIFAAIGRVVVIANSAIPRSLRRAEPISLDMLYPSLPTWWIPETPFSAICTLAVILFGLWLNAIAKRYERVLGWN